MNIAMISYHTCPLAVLGGKHTGGMNVYVRELTRFPDRRMNISRKYRMIWVILTVLSMFLPGQKLPYLKNSLLSTQLN